MIEARNAERKDQLMRTSFNGIIKDENNAAVLLTAEQQKQKESLEEAIARRNKGLKLNKAKITSAEVDETIDNEKSAIEDNYTDFVVTNNEKPKILDDDFMGELKLADVPDSDDECYF